MVTKDIDYFDLEQVADSGQCFRWRKLDEYKYRIPAFGNYVLASLSWYHTTKYGRLSVVCTPYTPLLIDERSRVYLQINTEFSAVVIKYVYRTLQMARSIL